MTAVLVVSAQAPHFAGAWRGLFGRALDSAATRSGSANALPMLYWSCSAAVAGTALALGLTWGAAALAAFSQGGLVFAPGALTWKLERLNPTQHISQLVSFDALSRVLKSLIPVAALLYLAAGILQRDWGKVLTLGHRNLHGLAQFALGDAFELMWKSALVLLLWGGADYLLQRQQVEGDLRMSREELLQEFKETDGNPTVKGRIRRLQRQMRKRRMLEEVKRASVVITNPTEFAVALEYSPGMNAPRVVAKGRNLVARQIKEVARWQGIPVIENPPLAHALYRAVEVGQSIPPKLYAVVAGILAAIHRAQERARARQAAVARGGK